jgi:hypothetical protein
VLHRGFTFSLRQDTATAVVEPTTPQIVAVRNDEKMLKALASTKQMESTRRNSASCSWCICTSHFQNSRNT